MKGLARWLRDGLFVLGVLGIPVALVALGLRPRPDDRLWPGENRFAFHLRTCPTCRPEEPHARSIRCPKYAALMKQIQDEFLQPQRGIPSRTDEHDPP